MAQTVVVLGATGTQGGSVVQTLVNDKSAEWKIRAITRDPSKDSAKALASKGVEIVAANQDDEGSLIKAFEVRNAPSFRLSQVLSLVVFNLICRSRRTVNLFTIHEFRVQPPFSPSRTSGSTSHWAPVRMNHAIRKLNKEKELSMPRPRLRRSNTSSGARSQIWRQRATGRSFPCRTLRVRTQSMPI